jgi:hypothetical protein
LDRSETFLHRLHATGEVDNGKAAMTQTDVAIDPDTARIRTTWRHGLSHRRDNVPLRPIAIVAHPTGYAPHRVTLSRSD